MPDSQTPRVDSMSPDSTEMLRGLARVSSLLADARDANDALERVGRVLTDVLHATRWSIMLKTRGDVIRISLARGLPQHVVEQTRVRLGEGIAGRVAQRGEGALYGNVEADVGMTSGALYASSSSICVPILLEGDVLGVINLSNKRLPGEGFVAFTDTDLTLALMTANQAAMLIRMLGDGWARSCPPLTQRPSSGSGARDGVLMQASAFDVLSRVTDLMTVSGDLDQVLLAAINGACRLLNAMRGSLMLYDDAHTELRIRAAIGMPTEIVAQVRVKPGEGIAGRVLQTGEALLLKNAPEARLGDAIPADLQAEQYRNRSALSVPLKSHGRVLGVININDRSDLLEFSEEDLHIARVIANQATVAISAANLLQESIAAAEMKRLLAVAHDIQENLLPAIPVIDGIDVAGCSDPCAAAGGDYIDFFPATETGGGCAGCLYLACGDVSGHGVGAALIMAMGRAFLRALLRQETDLAAVMYQMNNLIEADTPSGQFMTLFVGMLDASNRSLRYACAGHDPALLYRPNDDRMVETESTGVPLGMFRDQLYSVGTVDIQPGDVLVLSTDGVVEATDIEGRFYGRDRLKQDLKELATLPAADMVEAIRQRVLAFSYPHALNDDLSLIVTKIGG